METSTAHKTVGFSLLTLTKHAQVRMYARRLSDETVSMVMAYGRVVRVRGAEIYAIGRKEVKRYLTEGVNLGKFEGVQVVCSLNGSVLTVYRNHDFRGLRPRRFHRQYRMAA